MTVSYSGQKKGAKRNVKFRHSGTLRGSLDLFASNEPLSQVITEVFSMASAMTFSLKAKLYKERQAFGMIDYDNFEREGLLETELQTRLDR